MGASDRQSVRQLRSTRKRRLFSLNDGDLNLGPNSEIFSQNVLKSIKQSESRDLSLQWL